MRHLIRCCLMFCFVLSFSPSFSVEADEIDDMVYALNSKLIKSDVEGFSGLVTEFTSREKRFEDANYSKVGKTATSILTFMAILGDYVSHDVIKKSVCGEKIARVVTVVFASEGQYAVDYWFFKVKDNWALTTLNAKGEGNTLTFISKLTEMIKNTCE